MVLRILKRNNKLLPHTAGCAETMIEKESIMMDDKRKGEIALLLFKNAIREKGFTISSESRRKYIDTSKKIGIPKEEMFQFLNEEIKPFLVEMIDETLSCKARVESH